MRIEGPGPIQPTPGSFSGPRNDAKDIANEIRSILSRLFNIDFDPNYPDNLARALKEVPELLEKLEKLMNENPDLFTEEERQAFEDLSTAFKELNSHTGQRDPLINRLINLGSQLARLLMR